VSQNESKPGKSRRRFLADLLFLGGGVTAASLLAKSTLFQGSSTNPAPVLTPEPLLTPEIPKPNHPEPGMMALPQEPQVDGEFEIPVEQIPKEDCQPQIEGKMVMPEPNPAGGAMPVKFVPEGQK
jgi:hypothetical protein